jgi:WD40 repeat protein
MAEFIRVSMPDEGREPPAPETVFRGHTAEVMSVSFTAWYDSTSGLPHLLSGSADGEVKLWSLYTRRPIATVAAHSDASVLSVHALARSRVLSQGRDGAVRLWDAGNGALRGPLFALPSRSYNFCQCAVSPTLQHDEQLWDFDDAIATQAPFPAQLDAKPEATSLSPTAAAGGVSSSAGPSASLLAVATEDAQQVQLWDVRQRTAARTLAPSEALGRAGMCMCCRFVDDETLLSGWEDGSLQRFDLRGAAPVASRRLHSEPLLCIDVGPKAEHALTGAADCVLCIVPLSAVVGGFGEPIAQLSVPVTNEATGSGGLSSVSSRPDGRIFAAGGWDRRVRLWQWRNFKPLAVLKHHTGTVHSVHFSHCSRWLATASADKTIGLWALFPP